MTFRMWDTAAEVTPAMVDAAIARGYQAAALYGQPSAFWREVHAASDAEFQAASRMPRGVVLIHFGPDVAQAIAQADHLRSIGVNVPMIARDKEAGDTTLDPGFGKTVTATGRYLSALYGTPAGVNAEAAAYERRWLAMPGNNADPVMGTAIQSASDTLAGATVDVSRCAEDFLPWAGPHDKPLQEDNPMHVSHPTIAGRDDYAWVNEDTFDVYHEVVQNSSPAGTETLYNGKARSILGMFWTRDGQTLAVKVIGTDWNAYTWYLPIQGSAQPVSPVPDR